MSCGYTEDPCGLELDLPEHEIQRVCPISRCGRSSLPSSGETFSREKAREQQEGKDWRQALQWPSSCESQRMADGAQTDAIEPAWNSCCDACSCSDAVRQQGWQTLQELRRQKDIFTDGQVWLVWHSRQRGY